MTANGDPAVHVVVGQQSDRFELLVIQQVGFVDDQHGVAAPFGVFGGQRLGGLGSEGGFVVGRGVPEGGHDVGEHAAHPDGGVGQVDEHVPGWIQRRGGRPDGDGFACADFAGDHPDRALVHTPGDAGDRFTVAGMAVQHGGYQVAPERHPGESPM